MQVIIKPTNTHADIQGMDAGAAGRKDELQPGLGTWQSMMAGDLTAVCDNLGEAKVSEVIVAIVDWKNVERILNERVSGWKGHPKFTYPYPNSALFPVH